MLSLNKKLGLIALAAATIAGSTIAMTDMASARGFGHHGGFHGGFHGGRGFGVGAGVATGLALGALGAGYAYDYPGYGAYAYDDGYYGGDCVIRRRVHYTPYGPVVRHVRVCY
jgi:hypothetical protein